MGAFLRAGRETFRADRFADFFTTLRTGFLAGFLEALLAAVLETFLARRTVAFFAGAFFFAAFAAAFFAGFLTAAFLAGFAPEARFPAGLIGFRAAASRATGVSGLAGSGVEVDAASFSRSGRDTGGGGGVGGAGGGDDGIGSIHPDPDQPISMSWNAAIGHSLQRVFGLSGPGLRAPGRGVLYLAQLPNPCKL